MTGTMDLSPNEIKEAVMKGKLVISVYGLGWMGLPTACLLAEVGGRVIGVDTNRYIVELVRSGKSPVKEPNLTILIEKHIKEGRLAVTTDAGEAASKSDVIVIIVPTLVDKRKRPDYSTVEKVCRDIGLKLKKGSLVIFESTIGPGVTETLVKETLERASGLKAGTDFGLAYSPIRATAGRVLTDIQNYPRIVAGYDEKSLNAAGAVLETIVKGGIIKVSSIKVAEAAKLFENVYRDVNIALTNELAVLCEKLGIDFIEAREAANTQPYCHLHIPSIGVGGHCIPLNPYFIIEEGEAVGVKLRMVRLARKINDKMPGHTVRLVIEALRACMKTLKRSRVAVLGISYKANVKEARNSAAGYVVEALTKKGARVIVYDPYFDTDELMKMGYHGATGLERAVEGADCILLAVAHDRFKRLNLEDLARVVRRPAAIVDGCHILKPEEIRKMGFIYRGIGRGCD